MTAPCAILKLVYTGLVCFSGLSLSNVTSQSGVGHNGTPLFSASPLFGLSSLCDQLGALSTNELSVSPSDYSFAFSHSKDIGSISPTTNSLLGSSLHSSVSRSYSDSSRQDRAKNYSQQNEPFSHSPNPVGWNTERETNSVYINSDPWSTPHIPLALSKSHSQVFPSYSERINSEEIINSTSNIPAAADSDLAYLRSMRNPSGKPPKFQREHS